MSHNDITKPEVIRALIEKHEKSTKLRLKWNNLHKDLVNQAATFKREVKGYTESDLAKSFIEASLAATTRDHIEAGRNRRRKDLKTEYSISNIGLASREDPSLESLDDDLTGNTIMRPVPLEEKMMIYKELPESGRLEYLKARSKLPKKRRRVLPVEQPRRKREPPTSNRRVNAIKNPVVLKELSPEVNKFGVNGMNMISLALQAPPLLRPPATNPQPLQARAPTAPTKRVNKPSPRTTLSTRATRRPRTPLPTRDLESPIINPQSGAISLASLQPPLMTAPPLQPRPATTGALDLMLPLQPKLLPGYNLTTIQSAFLSNTLSTVRPPDLLERSMEVVVKEFKPNVEVIVEKRESISDSAEEKSCELDREVSEVVNLEENCNNVELDDNFLRDEINSNVIDTTNTSIVSSPNDNSNDNSNDNDQCPNNNSSL